MSEPTPEQIERHRLAVEAAKANQPAPTAANRRGCSGCGGEKFAPPVTPEAQEALLRDHLQ